MEEHRHRRGQPMNRANLIGGVGALAFSILTFAAMFIASPLGGDYSASDVATYVSSGHRTAVYAAAALQLIGVIGLICLWARLRLAVRSDGDSARMADSIM